MDCFEGVAKLPGLRIVLPTITKSTNLKIRLN